MNIRSKGAFGRSRGQLLGSRASMTKCLSLPETLVLSPESLGSQETPQSWTNWRGLLSVKLGTWNLNLLDGTVYRMATCTSGHWTFGIYSYFLRGPTRLEIRGERPKTISRCWEPLKNFWRVWGLRWILECANTQKGACRLLNIKPDENILGSKLKHQGGFCFWERWNPTRNMIPFYCSY